MASMVALEKLISSLPLRLLSRLEQMANAIGNIMVVVATFDNIAEINAVASINPNTILDGLLPVKSKILRAMRLCKFHFSIVRASKKPPKKINIVELKYSEAISCALDMPKMGNKITGKSAVMAIGIASVTHKYAIRKTEANILPLRP